MIGKAFAGALCAVMLCGILPSVASAASLRALSFKDLPGWQQDDPSAALNAFRESCRAGSARKPSSPALPKKARLEGACAAAQKIAPSVGRDQARSFFERWFSPALVEQDGFFTGYFEPEFAGSSVRTKNFSAPLLAYPSPAPSPFPDRAAIEAGALAGRGLELVWLDPVDAFFVHIQGSARIRLGNGTALRVGFAGRSGHDFTPIGRLLVERGAMTREQASMQTIRQWLRAHPREAPALMRENRSYIFFRILKDHGPEAGPVGAQGIPVTAGRTLAVDHTIWPYGLPVWVDVDVPAANGLAPMRRLMIAQDTGAAIRGPARADIFVGTGEAAGDFAGRLRHRGRFVVLVPRESPARGL